MKYWFFFWGAAAALSWCAGVVHSALDNDDPGAGYAELTIVGLCVAVLIGSAVMIEGYFLLTTGDFEVLL